MEIIQQVAFDRHAERLRMAATEYRIVQALRSDQAGEPSLGAWSRWSHHLGWRRRLAIGHGRVGWWARPPPRSGGRSVHQP